MKVSPRTCRVTSVNPVNVNPANVNVTSVPVLSTIIWHSLSRARVGSYPFELWGWTSYPPFPPQGPAGFHDSACSGKGQELLGVQIPMCCACGSQCPREWRTIVCLNRSITVKAALYRLRFYCLSSHVPVGLPMNVHFSTGCRSPGKSHTETYPISDLLWKLSVSGWEWGHGNGFKFK